MLDTHFWKKYFNVYDTLNELIPYKDLLNKIHAESLAKSGDKILDLGSGTGNLSMILKESGAKIYGIDFSDVGVEIHKNKDPESDIRVGDITKKLPYDDNFFDCVVSNNVIYTIPIEQRLDVFKEVHRILKSGGRFVVSNIAEGFKPASIYNAHLLMSTKKIGLFRTLLAVFKYIYPTILILYYNKLIKLENSDGTYVFLKQNEQAKLLKEAYFTKISNDLHTYADQAILNVGIK